MGHAGGEHAEGGQLLVPFHQRLAFHELDAQGGDHIAVNHPGQDQAEDKQQTKRAEHQPVEMLERFISLGEQQVARIVMRLPKILPQIEHFLGLRPQRIKVGQGNALPAERLHLDLQIPGHPQVLLVFGIHLLQRFFFVLRGQPGFLFLNPAVELAAGFQELTPDSRITIRGVTLHGVVQRPERLSELLGDTEALGLHLAQSVAQFFGLPLRVKSRQQNQHAHHRHRQHERHQSVLNPELHQSDWKSNPNAGPLATRTNGLKSWRLVKA